MLVCLELFTGEPGVPYNQSYLCLEKKTHYDKLGNKQTKQTKDLYSSFQNKI